MKEKLIHYRYIKTISEISVETLKQNEDIIFLFNIYISSNRNFKYNKTYLNDSLDDFFKVCDVFKKKESAVTQFMFNINNQYKSLGNWYIIIDHVFLLENNRMSLIVDSLEDDNCDNPFKKKRLEYELEQFNLYNLDKGKFVLKYYLDTELEHVDFTEECSIKNKLEISEFIKEQLEMKEEKDEN